MGQCVPFQGCTFGKWCMCKLNFFECQATQFSPSISHVTEVICLAASVQHFFRIVKEAATCTLLLFNSLCTAYRQHKRWKVGLIDNP